MTTPKANTDAVTRGVIPYIQVVGAVAAVDFYKGAFGAVERSRAPGPDGKLMNCQLKINGGLVMVMDAMPEHGFPSNRRTASPCSCWRLMAKVGSTERSPPDVRRNRRSS